MTFFLERTATLYPFWLLGLGSDFVTKIHVTYSTNIVMNVYS